MEGTFLPELGRQEVTLVDIVEGAAGANTAQHLEMPSTDYSWVMLIFGFTFSKSVMSSSLFSGAI